jgi:hypothetical protein
MKLGFLFIIVIFGFSFLQHGCGNANNTNQSSVNNQNLTIASTPSPLTANSSPNQNTTNNGASEKEARPFTELMERCKHTPINKAKVTPVTGTAPLKVTFNGILSYDPDGTKIVKWEWHFGNGQSSEGETVTYIYEKPGKYGIGLNVTDSQDQKTSDCSDLGTGIIITVNESQNTNEK